MRNSSEETTLDTSGLDHLIKAFSGKLPQAKVGILGGKNIRSNGEARSNATLGAKHEFGLDNMPVRSFLRVPIAEHMQKALEKSGAFNKDTLKKVVATGSIESWVKLSALIAEGIVAEGFNTGGYGKWPAWRNGYTSRTGDILVDTQQLRNSITSEVK